MDCGAFYSLGYILDNDNCRKRIPCCSKCGNIVKPDVVLYEEPLDDEMEYFKAGETAKAVPSVSF